MSLLPFRGLSVSGMYVCKSNLGTNKMTAELSIWNPAKNCLSLLIDVLIFFSKVKFALTRPDSNCQVHNSHL
jgi:hypothetical protein